MSDCVHSTCPGPVHRRDFLRAGYLGLAGLGLSDLLRCRAGAGDAAPVAEQPACILVWLGGGPSHLETYDMKPDAPEEYRGPFRPIRTNVPGIDVCELMPRHTGLADRFSLIRSCSHNFAGHQDGAQHVLTGWPAVLTGGGTITSVYPEIGSIFKKLRSQGSLGLPNYVAMPVRLGFVGPAYLGAACEPFEVGSDPNSPDFQVPNLSLPTDALARLEDRRSLKSALDRVRRDIDHSGVMEAMDGYDREAVRLLTGNDAQRAFDLSRADPRDRDRYGRSRAGQTLYLARRLIEAGVGFVTAEIASYRETGVEGGWDDHPAIKDIFDTMRRRLPVYDQAVTALIEDLYLRGLDKRVLVVVMGEFGRTPRWSVVNGRPGRDHWPWAMSILISGGGMRMGQVIGSTDAKAERTKDRALEPADLLATIYRFLDIDPQTQFRDHSGRPFAILPGGEPIRELLS